MQGLSGKYIASAVAGAVCLVSSLSFSAMAQGTLPNFAPDSTIGWYAYNRQFIPPPSGPGPVQQDPAHPYVTNDEFRVTGRQPTRTTCRSQQSDPSAMGKGCRAQTQRTRPLRKAGQ